MESEALIHREELVAYLFRVADVGENLNVIRELLEDRYGRGEDDAE